MPQSDDLTEEPAGSDNDPAAARVGLAAIFAAFFRLGCTSFGGGTAGWLHREMVLRRHWIGERDFLAMLSLGQALPGANGGKMTVLIGNRLHGALGSIVAMTGLLTGPMIIIIAIATVYGGLGEQPTLQAVFDGVAAAVVGLNLSTGVRALRHGAPGPLSLAIATATVLCVGVMRWPILPVILVLAPFSIGVAFVRGGRG